MDTPKVDLSDVQKLLDDGADEGLQLEFKASPSLTRESADVIEFCKDVSAFANSAGGRLIYGVKEDKVRKTFAIDEGISDPKIDVEWLQQKLNSLIRPKIAGIEIQQILLPSKRPIFILEIPATQTGPHQAPNKIYYKRYNKISQPMEDYEVRDVMGRASSPVLSLYVAVHAPTKSRQFDSSFDIPMSARIINRSPTPAIYSTFSLFVDSRLNVTEWGETRRGEVININGDAVTHIFKNFAAPADFPIFKENSTMPTRITVCAPKPDSSASYVLRARVSTPGFNRDFYGSILLDTSGKASLSWPETMLQ